MVDGMSTPAAVLLQNLTLLSTRNDGAIVRRTLMPIVAS